ncbi:ArsI/CadI family heavy metal resistance metalloenzyme [Kitasatospora sp. NPDC097643]|uniref:ArsI/CadI family heavy metal resistance metalloenzyme n=1 Tax=Kitasatospora sp. NPDC097643 TaxID=3157230 RepID=UPI00331D618C
MSRVQLALRVADLEGSIAFYSKLFGTEPAKRRPGYANFAIAEPPLKLVLIEGETGEDTRLDHLGVEVETTEQVTAATTRLKDAGLATFEENDTSCCYALQDKVWVHGPGKELWEVYVVKGDADTLGKGAAAPDACCGTTACCTSDEQAIDPAQGPAEAKAAAGCACGS